MASVTTKLSFLILTVVMMVVGALLTLFRILWAILTHPFTVFKEVPRNVPPDCLLDRNLGSHEYVTANGIKFHYVTAGDRSKPLMLFLHGFPEFWFSWRYQLPEFSKDYHVVAIDMRGYGETDRPPNKLDYTLDLLTQDIVELVPALGYSKCTLVAHDWGGVVAWRVVSRHPDLVEKFIVMNCPHAKVYSKYVSGNIKQILMSWYVFMFQWPKLPELALSLGDYSALTRLFTAKPSGLQKNKGNFTEEMVEAYKYVFSQPGALTAPINYYRCMFNQKSEKKGAPKTIETPVLIIWGDGDTALNKDMADSHNVVASNVTVRHIANCSHWVQQDAPEEVNQFMREFLQE